MAIECTNYMYFPFTLSLTVSGRVPEDKQQKILNNIFVVLSP